MAVMGGGSCASLSVVETQIMQTQVGSACAWLLLVGELVNRVVQDLVVRDPAHSQAVVPDMVLLLVAPCILSVAHLVDRHLMLRAASAAWLLAVAFVPMPVVAVPVVPLSSVSSASVPIHRTVALSTASVAVPSNDVNTEIEPVTAVWIGPRVSIAVVPVVADDALDPLVGLLGRLAIA